MDKKEDNLLEILKNEADEMPKCSEKIILNLIYQLIVLSGKEKQQEQIEKLNLDLEYELKTLKKQMEREDIWLVSYNKTYLEVIKELFKQSDYESSIAQLKRLLAEIRLIDLGQIKRIVKSNEKEINSLRGENIYLLLGQTGSGKSTILHYLAGSKMQQGILNGKTCVIPSEITNPDLQRVKVYNFL